MVGIADSGEVLTLRPIGAGGVDLFTDPSALVPAVLSRLENIDLSQGVAERRLGALKLAQLAAPATYGKSRTFAATTKYMTFAPPLIPMGGFAFYRHFTAVRTANTSWLLSSRPAGQTFHILKVTLSSAGAIAATWRDSGGSDRTVTTAAVSDGAVVHLFGIYDAFAGTYTLYVNGASSGTPLTGLASTLKPDQSTATWALGVEKETGAAVTANTNFDGLDDGFTLFSLRGLRPSSGTTTLVEMLRRHSARAWPSPQAPFVLANYALDEASGTVAYDSSNGRNHGTYVGSPSVTNPVALLSAPVNCIARTDTPSGKTNIAVAFGAMNYQQLAEAAA